MIFCNLLIASEITLFYEWMKLKTDTFISFPLSLVFKVEG